MYQAYRSEGRASKSLLECLVAYTPVILYDIEAHKRLMRHVIPNRVSLYHPLAADALTIRKKIQKTQSVLFYELSEVPYPIELIGAHIIAFSHKWVQGVSPTQHPDITPVYFFSDYHQVFRPLSLDCEPPDFLLTNRAGV